MKKLISLLLCLCLLLGASALAEAPAADQPAAQELNADDVLVTVNGTPLTWAEIEVYYNSLLNNYGSYYTEMPEADRVAFFRAAAMENKIAETMLNLKGVEMGLELTEEENAAADASAQSDWDAALASYVSQTFPDLNDESAQEEKDKADAEAVKYFNDLGYTPETLQDSYRKNAFYNKVQTVMVQDATVTDEEVEAKYQELVAADKELYQDNLDAYVEYNSYVDQMAMYAMYYGSASNTDYAWYRPAGFRHVKHILLEADADLLSNFQDLTARLEEQMEAETAQAEAPVEPAATDDPAATVAPDATATPEPTATPVPVTQADVDAAKQAILTSLQDKIDEINQKIADGADFDELIAEYGVKADGTATDPGMTSSKYPDGYEVSVASTNYVLPFVSAAFSVKNVGEVSAPAVSTYGVHIVKYVDDIPEGPVAMTDAQREAKRAELLQSKQNALYEQTMTEWMAAATIEYSGLIPTMAEIEAKEAAAQATEAPAEPEATEVPAA